MYTYVGILTCVYGSACIQFPSTYPLYTALVGTYYVVGRIRYTRAYRFIVRYVAYVICT
jgi:hypothetical protein